MNGANATPQKPAAAAGKRHADTGLGNLVADPVDLGGGRWLARIFINRHPATGELIRLRADRRFEADGIRRARTQARQIEATIRSELEAAQHNPTPTVRQAAEDWWVLWSKRTRSPTTRKSYRSILDVHILDAPFADKAVDKITTGEVERWYSSLDVAPATVRRIHAVFNQVLRQQVRDGTLTQNPAELAYKPEARPKEKTHTPVGTINLILAAAARRHPVRARVLAFAARTGLRRGEVCGLRHSLVDVDRGAIKVAYNVVVANSRFVGGAVPAGRRTRAVVKDPKAHQVAFVALDSQAVDVVVDQARWQAEWPCCDDPYLWSVTPPFDQPLNPDTLGRWFAQAAKDAGVRGVTLHDLRHWQGSQVLEAGGTLQDAKERLRHRSMQTTQVYLHADPTKQQALAELIPRFELP